MAGWAKGGYIIGRYLIAVGVDPCLPVVSIGSAWVRRNVRAYRAGSDSFLRTIQPAELAASAAAIECVRSRLLIISAVGIFHHVLFRLNIISELLYPRTYSTRRRAKREWVTEAWVHHQLAINVPSGIRARLGLPKAMLSWLLGYSGTRSTPRYSWPTASHTCP